MTSPLPYPEEFRDCVTDVLALVEACLLTKDTDPGKNRQGIGDTKVLLDNADREGCLRVAIPLLANAWHQLSTMQGEAKGTSAAEELACMLDLLRSALGRLICG